MDVHLENANLTVALDAPLGLGGADGVLYRIPTMRGFGFKLSNGIVAATDEKRLRYLASHPLVSSSNGHRFIGPVDIGLKPNTKDVVGYLMSFESDAIDLINIIQSNTWIPESFLVRVARNHVAALMDLHRMGYRRGDLPNSMVRRDGSVCEIDLDKIANEALGVNSGQAKTDHAAPELLGEDIRNIPTEVEHDVFAIAVVIWQLLRRRKTEHPFATHYVGPLRQVPKRWKRVKEGKWPWSASDSDYEPPKGAPPLSTLDPALESLFWQCFDKGCLDPAARPSLQQIHSVLSRLDTAGSVHLSDIDWQCVKDGTVPTKIKRSVKPVVPNLTPLGLALLKFPLTVWGAISVVIVGQRKLLARVLSIPSSVANSITIFWASHARHIKLALAIILAVGVVFGAGRFAVRETKRWTARRRSEAALRAAQPRPPLAISRVQQTSAPKTPGIIQAIRIELEIK